MPEVLNRATSPTEWQLWTFGPTGRDVRGRECSDDAAITSVVDVPVVVGTDGLMDNDAARGLLRALADALPEGGPSELTGLTVRQGWGGILNVRLHTAVAPTSPGWELGSAIRRAVDVALDGRRHDLTFVWEPPLQSTAVHHP